MSNYDAWKTRSDREDDMIDPDEYDTSGPGKFESEPPESKYYYEKMLAGDGEWIEDDSVTVVLFRITPEESQAFGLADSRFFMIVEDSDDGSIYGSAHPNIEHAERKYRAWLGLPTQ